MYTQCPNCNVVFSMSEDDLDKYQGLVRCGRCNEVFNASWNLVDSIPNEQPVGPGYITPKPEQKAVVTPDVIDEFILDNVETGENSDLPSESAEASEQEQSLYSDNEMVDGSIDVEQGFNVVEPDPIEAATDTLPASDESLPTESILDEVAPEDSRIGDDMEGSVESLDEDEPDWIMENEELSALDLAKESQAADTEQVHRNAEIDYADRAEQNATSLMGQADQDMEREAETEEESKAIDRGLPEVGAIEAENDGLEAESGEIEEILIEEPDPDDDLDTAEESPTAEREPDEEEVSAGLLEAGVIEAETNGLEEESPEAEATTEEILMEEPGPDDDL
ncbi:MAG: zinc-ribbon domain-containing protein, partial [Arenicellales bacterium]|nr:zinc-ribbon domain-containing protein [Arenicellales bacterium]